MGKKNCSQAVIFVQAVTYEINRFVLALDLPIDKNEGLES